MKRFTTIILALILCFSLFAPLSLAGFSDITDGPTQTAASLLQSLGIVAGYNDGKFHPNDKLTRAQFCKMAVLLSGFQEVTAFEGYTIFPDVRAGYWGRGYINAAVRESKIIAGFPDGTFRPDTPISYAQAVTILMRLLGYTDADVGINWPRGYLSRAAAIGLTKGITLKDNDPIARGIGARLFYNAIFTKTKEGGKYSETLGIVEEKLIVLKTNGLGPDGITKGLITLGGNGFYPCRAALSVGEGERGTLLVDGDGYALAWTPDKQTQKDIVVREAGPMSVTGLDGGKVDNIPSAAAVYKNGEKETWEKCWIDIRSGQALRFFFNAAGAVDYVLWFDAAADGDVKVLSFEPAKGQNPLPSLGADSGARVFKNGVAATWADLRQGDVVTVNTGANTVSASDFRITGIYENAKPNREAPDVVTTLGGQTFDVLPAARAKLATYKIGDALTFSFTQDNRVADVQSRGNVPTYQPGIVTGEDEVTLYNGMVLEGTIQSPGTYGEGAPVLAAQSDGGRLSIQTIPSRGSAALDLKNMKVGSAEIAPYAIFIDRVGGRAVFISRETLPDTVTSGKVLSVNFDTGGRANLIVLDDATGNAWLYGFISIERNRVEDSGFEDENGNPILVRLPDLVTVSNQNGEYSFTDSDKISKGSGGVGGVVAGTNGKVLKYAECVRVNNVKRSDFTGNHAITISGKLLSIPDGLKVYVQQTKKYITVAEARVYSNDFTVYLDKPAAEGGKPRFIVAL